MSARRVGRTTALDSNGVEPRDPLEVLLLGGDRDEYVDRSFWHDAEADGVTFQVRHEAQGWNEWNTPWPLQEGDEPFGRSF